MNSASSPFRHYFTLCAAIFAPLVIAITVLSLKPGYGLSEFLRGEKPPTTVPPTSRESDAPSMAERLDQEFQRLTGQIMPSVVSVHTRVEKQNLVVKIRPGMSIEEMSTEYGSQPGVGSGVIVSKEGHILTNWHVIQDVTSEKLATGRDFLFVSLHDEKVPRQVDIIGVDKKTDLAVLKLRGPLDKELPVLTFGDSDQIRRGNIVLALGSPFGLSETVTQGILSHCERRLGDTDDGPQYLQTDCVINPGNSGGPLVNLKGEMIGINWAVYIGQSDIQTWQGVGLAIRSNDAREAYENILNKSGPRGYIGIMFEERNSIVKDENKVVLESVIENSPAYDAGLRPGDVLQMIDGIKVTTLSEAWKHVQRKKIGEHVSFQILRSEVLQPPMEVKIESMEEAPSAAAQIVDLTKEIGVKVKDSDSKEFFILNKARGWRAVRKFVIVKEVSPHGKSSGKVKVGDVLVAATLGEEKPVRLKSTNELQATLSKWKPGEALTLQWWRDSQTTFPLTLTRD